jgi:hypothetical protein
VSLVVSLARYRSTGQLVSGVRMLVFSEVNGRTCSTGVANHFS